VLTWWRRRAQRAPARQGAACRPVPSRRCARRSRSGSGNGSRASSRCPSVLSRSSAPELGHRPTAWRANGAPLKQWRKLSQGFC
jgi:hypothetical protein